MSSLNRVIMIGRLTRDPELRTTTTGKQVVGFGIAVDRMFKSEGGQDVDFFNVTAWGKTAEFVANYLAKGRLVAVDGRLQTRKYQNKEGENREVFEIVAENVQGLDRPRDDSGGGASPARMPAPSTAPSDDEFDPFADE
ncbi:MAG: single-stranded DNA-binding protein [Fimbriimonadaceae bacterium]|nr:single-stranded DNA-binding protein [Fimbriimonadaceae bacterium]